MNTLPRRTTFIYALLDPRTFGIRYVGKADNPHNRWLIHKGCYGRETHCMRWIRKLKAEGFEPGLKIIEEVDYSIWPEREQYWIEYYQTIGTPLTNITRGGKGGDGTKHTEEIKQRIGARFKGVPLSEQHKQKLRVAKIRKFQNPEARAVLSRHWASLTDEQAREVQRLAIIGELTHKQIGLLFGISSSVVSEIRSGKRYKHAVNIPDVSVLKDARRIRAIPRLKQVVELRLEGRSQKEVARLMGLTVEGVGFIVAKAIERGFVTKEAIRAIPRRVSEEGRRKLSLAHIGYKASETAKMHMSEALRKSHAKRRAENSVN